VSQGTSGSETRKILIKELEAIGIYDIGLVFYYRTPLVRSLNNLGNGGYKVVRVAASLKPGKSSWNDLISI
jgi:hypothetical protein